MRVMEEYEKLAEADKMTNIFTSACPSSNFLIQKYYPELIKYLAPVDTPIEAHAEMMRKAYGRRYPRGSGRSMYRMPKAGGYLL